MEEFMRKLSLLSTATAMLVGAVLGAQPGRVTGAATPGTAGAPAAWDPARGILIDGATVVTMDDQHTVVPHGRVLVRNGRVVAVWSGPRPPDGITIGDASVIKAGPQDLLYPGLINLHSHPNDNFLEAWLPPSSHAIPQQAKAGTDPYANRYQWGGSSSTSPPELRRLVANPRDVLGDDLGLGLHGEIVKYAEVAAMLGGETAIQGASPDPRSDDILIRNIDNDAFDTRIGPPRISSIASFGGAGLADFVDALRNGQYDAWIIHLAEGVRDADRRPGDPVSTRAELATLKSKGLLTDTTVIIHGTAFERSDFAEMRAAPSVRTDGVGDGRGAKLVWSPLSNLLLYGETTNVYDALAEGVLVSLGTDWTPSGSRTLLHELKVADLALRDPRVLGGSRDEVPAFAIGGKQGAQRQLAEDALDQALVDMVTRNPALTLRWYDKVGSIEAGKIADLMFIHRPQQASAPGRPPSVYRDLINATERDVQLVLVSGEPLAGQTALMPALKPGDYEIVASVTGGFQKAVDVTTTAPVPDGDETLAQITTKLQAGLTALGGDNPPPGGGPGPATNTYSYLKAHVAGGAAASLPDPVFRGLLAGYVGVLPDGSLNLERMQLDPLFEADDDFLGHVLHADVDPATGLLADPTPPYRLYPANLNQIGPLGNPLLNIP
jgi:cytosine/adenosine deaminase-related metal-dependent hydrolase